MNEAATATKPIAAGRDDRKSGGAAARKVKPPKGATNLTRFADLREIFRSPRSVQAMDGADAFGSGTNPDQMPVAFLDGDPHKKRRAAIAKYFTPKAIITRYHDVINRTSDALIAELRANGSAVLDLMSFQLAVDVTAEVVGLTASDNRGLAKRLRGILDIGLVSHPVLPVRMLGRVILGVQMQHFYKKDVAPAIAARRIATQDDVISYMVENGYSKRAMLIECMIYGMAGMVTTRELITMAAWHMLDDPALKQRYLDAAEDEQFAIVEEVLRLEPVAGMLYRKVIKDIGDSGETLATGEYNLDLRAANLDEAVTGPNPYALDPDRAKRMRVSGHYMSFGDGAHRCPGAQLALHETRAFLDKLMRVPGLRLVKPPRMKWSQQIQGYELRDTLIACDRA